MSSLFEALFENTVNVRWFRYIGQKLPIGTPFFDLKTQTVSYFLDAEESKPYCGRYGASSNVINLFDYVASVGNVWFTLPTMEARANYKPSDSAIKQGIQALFMNSFEFDSNYSDEYIKKVARSASIPHLVNSFNVEEWEDIELVDVHGRPYANSNTPRPVYTATLTINHFKVRALISLPLGPDEFDTATQTIFDAAEILRTLRSDGHWRTVGAVQSHPIQRIKE